MKALDRPLLGAVYLVEPNLSAERQAADLRRMAEAGFNLCVLWPPVSRWEAPDGHGLAFGAIDRAMDACAKHGMAAILELEGQNPAFQFAPDATWTMDRLPQSNRARHWVSYFHPDAAKEIDAYVKAVAEHFKDHPALFGYDLFNEVNFHSTDPHTQSEFRAWLKSKYKEVKELNRAWGRFYSDFAQVHLENFAHPYSKWSSLRHLLDFEDFRADAIVKLVKRWTDVVRSVDAKHPVIVDNSWSMTTFDTTILANDDWKIAAAADVFGLSVYPQSWDVRLRENPCAVAQIYRGGVCAGSLARGKAVMVSELQTHNQTALARGSSVHDEVKLWTWQAFAHGVEGLVYWKWNPFTRGFQVAGRGMTAPDGEPNARAAQATAVAKVLHAHPDLFVNRRVFDSGVALLYHPTCDRFTDLILPDEPGLYRASLAGWYRYLWEQGVQPAFVQADDLLKEATRHLKLLVVPCQMMLGKAHAGVLKRFVAEGGSILADGRFAIVDEEGFAYERAPGHLTETFGYLERDYLSPYGDANVSAGERFCKVALCGATGDATSALGDPVSAETAKTCYLAAPFGMDIRNESLRAIVNRFVLPRLDRRCQILTPHADVDALVVHAQDGKHGKGPGGKVVLAVTNYAREARTVRAKLDATGTVTALFEGVPHEAKSEGGVTVIECTVPPRDVAGFAVG